MNKTAHESSKSGPSPASSPRSAASIPPASPASPPASSHLHPVVATVNTVLSGRLREEDLASWGAYSLEDMGILEVDRVIGTSAEFGAAIRRELLAGGSGLSHHWTNVANRLMAVSPAMSNPTSMIAVLCQMAAVRLFIEDRIHARP